MPPDRADLGLVLRLLRRRQQLSQHQLALKSGLQQRQISFFESGRAQPRLPSLQRLAVALDLQPLELQAVLRCAAQTPATRALGDPPPSTWLSLAQSHRWPALLCDMLGGIHAVNEGLERMADAAGVTVHWPGTNLYRLSFSSSGLLSWLENPAQVWAWTKWQALARADYAPYLLRLFADLEKDIPKRREQPQPAGIESYRTPKGRWSFHSWTSTLGHTGRQQGAYFLYLLQPLDAAHTGGTADIRRASS